MNPVLFSCLACLAIAPLMPIGALAAGTVPLDVELKLTDEEYQPLADVPVRLVFGIREWQAADAGVRIVTGKDGTANFTTKAVVDRRWNFSNIGFTPFSVPFRADHISIAAELAFVMPKRDAEDAVHHWLYTADIDRLPDGDCSTSDLDRVYEAGPDGRFTKLVGSNASGPNFDGLVDGWKLTGAGYKLWQFMLEPKEDGAGNKSWRLKLGLMRNRKPILPN
jgi:hypothetical protein